MKSTIIIAEAGVNHNGNFEKAKKLIDIASEAKANYVKFQFYKTGNLVVKNSNMALYQKKNFKRDISQYKLLKKYELSLNSILKLRKYSKKKNIKFLTSVFDTESLEELFKSKIYDIKVPSGEINNFPLLEKISKKAKRIFISSGMSYMEEIALALKILKRNNRSKKNLYLMHCHSEYPTDLKDVNLLVMPELRKKFKIKIGFSDHTLGNEVGVAATALGADVIEKHFTLSKKMSGPDHKASLDPKELKLFVQKIRNTEILLGSSKKNISKKEYLNKKFVRKSIVAKRFIKKGEKFLSGNLICKRPEGGLSPKFLKKIIGKKAKKNYLRDQLIFL